MPQAIELREKGTVKAGGRPILVEDAESGNQGAPGGDRVGSRRINGAIFQLDVGQSPRLPQLVEEVLERFSPLLPQLGLRLVVIKDGNARQDLLKSLSRRYG